MLFSHARRTPAPTSSLQLPSFLPAFGELPGQPVPSILSELFIRKGAKAKDNWEKPLTGGPVSIYPASVAAPALGGMAPVAAQLLICQLVWGPILAEDIKEQIAVQNFRTLHIDYPRVSYPEGFQGYCNGLMAYVRGKMQTWNCPKTYYVVHTPWNAIVRTCKLSESFCENYNEYCTLTQDSFPLTVCTLALRQPPTSCRYTSTLSNRRLYLLCSRKYEGEPMGIIGYF
ncbi:probable inactive ribonuclease-like protein 13 isoform X2 [Nycticebus coucang]|uniref:probable inactive ribonuclease-like protein 13 isoform X2 n=1 Tax=Nycticebus coucang TaxID=9470 RepID=UPI00234C4E3B|nr:probable inactive ribonuclease-like protein 13 isoform X2 [Nycticebus coucang]